MSVSEDRLGARLWFRYNISTTELLHRNANRILISLEQFMYSQRNQIVWVWVMFIFKLHPIWIFKIFYANKRTCTQMLVTIMSPYCHSLIGMVITKALGIERTTNNCQMRDWLLFLNFWYIYYKHANRLLNSKILRVIYTSK